MMKMEAEDMTSSSLYNQRLYPFLLLVVLYIILSLFVTMCNVFIEHMVMILLYIDTRGIPARSAGFGH